MQNKLPRTKKFTYSKKYKMPLFLTKKCTKFFFKKLYHFEILLELFLVSVVCLYLGLNCNLIIYQSNGISRKFL